MNMATAHRVPGAGEVQHTDARLVYFSSVSGNTHRFIVKLGRPAARIPLHRNEPALVADRDYVLVLPTYGGEKGAHTIPPQVMTFLREPRNREHLAGVIGAGNTNFGTTYNLAAHKIAAKLQVPVLYLFELMGTPEDVTRVNQGLDELWTRQSPPTP